MLENTCVKKQNKGVFYLFFDAKNNKSFLVIKTSALVLSLIRREAESTYIILLIALITWAR